MGDPNTEHGVEQWRSPATATPKDLRLYRLRPAASLTRPVGIDEPGPTVRASTADLSHWMLRKLQAHPLVPDPPSPNGTAPPNPC